MSIRTKITPNGNLLITADNDGRRELTFRQELGGFWSVQDHVIECVRDEGYEFIPPEAIGALTDAPIFGEGYVDDDGEWQVPGNVFWFPDYMVTDPWEELRRRGRVVFTFAPVEPEPAPRPLDAVAARVVAEMAAPRQSSREAVTAALSRILGRSMTALAYVGKGC